MDGLTEGRIVHYVMIDGAHRPAIIVNVVNKQTGEVNMNVFTDPFNDVEKLHPVHNALKPAIASGIFPIWGTLPDEVDKVPGTWHWIEKA